MRTQKERVKRIIVYGSIVVAIVIFNRVYTNMHESGMNAEAITNLKSFAIAQEAYFGEYGKYGNSADEIGYSIKGGALKVYSSKASLPQEYLSALKEKSLPFVRDDSYQILLAKKNALKKQIDFWIIGSNLPPTKLEKSVKLQ